MTKTHKLTKYITDRPNKHELLICYTNDNRLRYENNTSFPRRDLLEYCPFCGEELTKHNLENQLR